MPKSIGDPGYDPAYNDAFFRQQNALQATTSEVSARRSAFYESQVEQELSPAQIYANMLAFNANQSEDYWNSLNVDPDQTNRSAEHFQAQHDYLQNLIDQNRDFTSST